MSSYKLYYFDGRGRGETARMLFAIGGQKFEDIRFSGDKWPEFKPKMILGQVPVLEIDGQQLPQSRAIDRYLARQYGLYGSNNLEGARIDAVCDAVEELMKKLFQSMFFEKDEAKKKAGLASYYADDAPGLLGALVKLLDSYGGGDDGFFVGNKISLADIFFFAMTEYFEVEEFAKQPKLKALRDRVGTIERLASYMENRPTQGF